MQILVGRLICQAQQIELAEEWGLESIATEFAQRQVLLLFLHDNAAKLIQLIRSTFWYNTCGFALYDCDTPSLLAA